MSFLMSFLMSYLMSFWNSFWCQFVEAFDVDSNAVLYSMKCDFLGQFSGRFWDHF